MLEHRIITNRAVDRQIIDNARRQPYVAILELRSLRILRYCLGAAALLLRGRDRPVAAAAHPFYDTIATDWENASWHDPSRSSPASGPT